MGAALWTVASLIQTTANFLGPKGIPSPRLEAEILLAKVLDLSRVALYVNFDRALTGPELDAYRELVRRRSKFEPSAYILGEKEFYKLPLKVSPATLIPRPETEGLVDEALRLARAREDPLRVLDVGAGSGAIALAFKANLPAAEVWGVDISPAALAIARENARALALDARFLESDLLRSPELAGDFDLILANLPYVPTPELAGLPPDTRDYEPTLALDGGPDGLNLYRRLLAEAPPRLRPQGRLLLEIHPPQLEPLSQLARERSLEPLAPVLDYSSRPRIFVARHAAPPNL
ncbi:MAG: peptide chain release factor N(5)-glutamine methyltransferase [Deltaproteobacteria bacterium]|jgi:release factor glutamine methyltransferase|nr:peptide chain release factor N(5)-glutamine methyltransferase [Deltaproteobacteria bacterium]